LPLIIGGTGEQRTLRLVARYADEWNSTGTSLEALRHKNEVLAKHCEEVQRDPTSIKRSMMNFAIVGPDDAFRRMVAERVGGMRRTGQQTPEEVLRRAPETGMIAGDTRQVVDYLGELSRLGIQEVMFQHYFFDRDEAPEYLAKEILPRVRAL
jgi:alkanesulfonate monooxygenase SsuD/methylene tetrahydromethanopterin reductase-like flavin-dependent oxidoreductase (luciferase family)